MKRKIITLLAGIAVIGCWPAFGQQKKVKRIWTNDDFPAAAAPALPRERKLELVKLPASAPAQNEPLNIAPSPATLATARVRQKAYAETISDLGKRLETETSPFRIEVYRKLLNDALELDRINQALLRQPAQVKGRDHAQQ